MSKRHNCSSCKHWLWEDGADMGSCEHPEGPLNFVPGMLLTRKTNTPLTTCDGKCDNHERHPIYGKFEETP